MEPWALAQDFVSLGKSHAHGSGATDLLVTWHPCDYDEYSHKERFEQFTAAVQNLDAQLQQTFQNSWMCSKTNYRQSIRQGIFSLIKNEGDRRRSDTVVVLTVHHDEWRLVVVSFFSSFSTFLTPRVVLRGGSQLVG